MPRSSTLCSDALRTRRRRLHHDPPDPAGNRRAPTAALIAAVRRLNPPQGDDGHDGEPELQRDQRAVPPDAAHDLEVYEPNRRGSGPDGHDPAGAATWIATPT